MNFIPSWLVWAKLGFIWPIQSISAKQTTGAKIYELTVRIYCRAATANFWQARPSQWLPHQRRAAVATAIFYSAKSRQGLGLGGLASHGDPVPTPYNHVAQKEPFMKRFPVYWYESLQDCEKSNSRKLLQESMSLTTLKTRNFFDLIVQFVLKFRYSLKATNFRKQSLVDIAK